MADVQILGWKGLKEFEHAVTSRVEKADIATRDALIEAADLVKKLSGQRAPHLSGRLAGSIEANPPTRAGVLGGWQTQVGVSGRTAYGRLVELGLRGTRHQPHHFFADGYGEAATQFPALFARAWGRHIGGV